MKRIALLFTFFLSVFLSSSAFASETVRVMPLQDVYGIVLANHPLAKQAETFPDAARQELRSVRGLFDPELKSVYNDKKYDDKNYWKIWESSLSVPLWPGVDVKIAYDQHTGEYLNPSETIPLSGLSYAGFSVPIGQGLLIDARRSAVKQAQLLSTLAEAERIKAVNKLLLQVTKDYWDWSFTYQRRLLHEESLRLAQVRFEAIRDRVVLGDQPAIDSLEAFIEVQNRENILNQSTLEYKNARLLFSNHLWNDKGEPVEPSDEVIPETGNNIASFNLLPLEQLLDSARTAHPELIKLQVKTEQLEIEKKWAREKLKPKLNLDYNFLSPGNDLLFSSDYYSPSFSNNYKFGVSFSMPLFLREERGKLGGMRLKIEQTRYEQQQLSRVIMSDVRASYTEMSALADQIRVQQAQLLNAERLLEGEKYRFDEGESFLFLVNNRENAVIGSRIKLAELQTKFAKSIAQVNWTAGNLIAR